MKILSAQQIRQADAYTIAHEPIAALDLMERASAAFVRAFVRHYALPCRVWVACGNGNNGADGLCIARLLAQLGYDVSVCVAYLSERSSPEFACNMARLLRLLPHLPIYTASSTQPPPAIAADVLIDALLGTGINRPITQLLAQQLIGMLNQHPAPTVAVDMPSGLLADAVTQGDWVVRAARTITFAAPKLAFLLPDCAAWVGNWQTVSIGLDRVFWQDTATPYHYISPLLAQQWHRPTAKFAHKGTRGHLLVVGGSYGKMGAAALAANAALRAGAGLVTAYVPSCGYNSLQTIVPEALTECPPPTAPAHYLTAPAPNTTPYRAVAVGMGLGTHPHTAPLLYSLLCHSRLPMVLDADALNLIAQHGWQRQISPNSIITPHPKEFERLAGATAHHFERLQRLTDFAQQHQITVVLKGAHTAVALPNGEVYFNSTGNPAMATAGSGDVLSGIIGALLAQQYPPQQAALLGVYQHGAAGDRAAAAQHNSITAMDIVRHY